MYRGSQGLFEQFFGKKMNSEAKSSLRQVFLYLINKFQVAFDQSASIFNHFGVLYGRFLLILVRILGEIWPKYDQIWS